MKVLLLLTINLFSITYAETPRLTDQTIQKHSSTIQDIALYMSKINPKLLHAQTLYLAYHIVNKSLERKLDPFLVTSIIAVESHFKLNAYNPSGDYSLAQINYRVWSKEFPRVGYEPLCKVSLKEDPAYAINKMTKILSIIKKRHDKDSKWHTRYHSSTKKYRKSYEKKLKKHILALTRANSEGNIASNETIGGKQ